jgi:hypothetical protein
MAALVWVMVGLAIWHFTIFLPDRFLGGIVGAFVGCVIGSLVFGYLISGLRFPGNDDMSLVTAIEAIPGTVIGMGVVYLLGVRAENKQAASAGRIQPSR